ncbi:MAG: DNA polymerase III subunit gamma/tau [Steroidobacteraceae bacterium]
MSYLVLARKWRPRTFDELVGQDHVRRALVNALDSGRIHHAFLFTGTRGVGKTTIARIFAKSLNCETGVTSKPCGECSACRDIDAGRFVDLLEVDAASRTKVDDTRELLDNVQYSPARGRYKVYLIDEVHMLSTHSFNALLKTLEEPPPHVKFLLATTDPQKVPVTVLSRCLQFHLRRLPLALIQERLAQIATAEKVEFEPAALRAIARGAEGSMRDALSLLDQVLAFGGGRAIESEVRALLGTLDRRHVEAILNSLAAHDGTALMASVRQLDERAPDYDQALGELAAAVQRMAILRTLPDLRGEDEEEDAALAALATRFTPEDLQLLYQIAIMARRDLDYAPDARGGFEMALLRMLAFRPDAPAAAAPAAAPRSAPAGGRPAGSGPAAAPARSAPAPAAEASPPTAATETIGADDWSAVVAQLGQGPVSQLAAHCVPVGRANGVVRLRLDPKGESFNRPQLVDRLSQALAQVYGEPVRLEISIGAVPAGVATPAQRQAEVADERLRAAEQAIDADPAVRAMRDTFGATVQPGSIRPLN